MRDRLNPYKSAPDAMHAMIALERYLQGCGLDKSLMELVKMRASQINGCAFCLDMHSKDARKAGETEQRLYLLPAWRETNLFSPKERAALAWTEALTRVADSHAPETAYEEARVALDEAELTKLTLLIGAINIWNRFAIGFRMPLPA